MRDRFVGAGSALVLVFFLVCGAGCSTFTAGQPKLATGAQKKALEADLLVSSEVPAGYSQSSPPTNGTAVGFTGSVCARGKFPQKSNYATTTYYNSTTMEQVTEIIYLNAHPTARWTTTYRHVYDTCKKLPISVDVTATITKGSAPTIGTATVSYVLSASTTEGTTVIEMVFIEVKTRIVEFRYQGSVATSPTIIATVDKKAVDRLTQPPPTLPASATSTSSTSSPPSSTG